MKKIKVAWWLVAIAAGLSILPALATPSRCDPATNSTLVAPQPPTEPISRPLGQFLHNCMTNGRAMIPEPYRTRMADHLLQMDQRHAAHLGHLTGPAITDVSAADQWIQERTDRWPALVPYCERTIWALLQLQVEMLERMVQTYRPQEADNLEAVIHKRRIRDKTERFFHDYQDQFICVVLDSLEIIAQLQSMLGVSESVNLDFPTGIENTSELHTYLVDKIAAISERALEIQPLASGDS